MRDPSGDQARSSTSSPTGVSARGSGLAARAVVVPGDAFRYLERPDAGAFDVIYIAPPQYRGLWLRALQAVDARCPGLLAGGGRAIVQVFPKEWSDPSLVNLELLDRRQYGSTALFLYGQKGEHGGS
jgi:16S rRNA G966 N2-methylase RsmD